MTIRELKTRLKEIEWNDIEFKEAQNEVPKSAYETVSAFANTHGGWLVFGIAQKKREFEIAGVSDPDRIQNDFLSALHADNKVNHDIQVKEKLIKTDGKVVLAFFIPEASRVDKPIYLNDRIRRRSVERWVENIVNASIDISKILLASEKKKLPDTYREVLDSLCELPGFDKGLSVKLADNTKLRNVLAHEYLDLRFEKLQSFVLSADGVYKKLISYVNKVIV